MKGRVLLAVLAILLWVGTAQHIVDYTHAHELENIHFDIHKNYQIDIATDSIQPDFLDFPQSCHLADKLSEISDDKGDSIINQKTHMDELRSNMTALLTLSEEMKLIKQELIGTTI